MFIEFIFDGFTKTFELFIAFFLIPFVRAFSSPQKYTVLKTFGGDNYDGYRSTLQAIW